MTIVADQWELIQNALTLRIHLLLAIGTTRITQDGVEDGGSERLDTNLVAVGPLLVALPLVYILEMYSSEEQVQEGATVS